MRVAGVDQRVLDLSALNLTSRDDEYVRDEEPPKMIVAREKVIEEARQALEKQRQSDLKQVSLVVIGVLFYILDFFFISSLW